MERRIEYRNLRHMLTKHLAAGLDRKDGGWVMQRRKLAQALDFAEHIVGDQNRFCKIFAAVNDTLSDCADFTDVFQRASLSLDQMPDQLAQRLRMCRKCDFAGVLDAVRAGMRNCAIDADAFTIALSEHLFAVHIDQLIL